MQQLLVWVELKACNSCTSELAHDAPKYQFKMNVQSKGSNYWIVNHRPEVMTTAALHAHTFTRNTHYDLTWLRDFGNSAALKDLAELEWCAAFTVHVVDGRFLENHGKLQSCFCYLVERIWMVIVLLDECRKKMTNACAIEVVGCNDICNVVCMILNITRHHAILYYSIPYRCLFRSFQHYINGCMNAHKDTPLTSRACCTISTYKHHYLPSAPLFARSLPIFVSCLHIVGSRCTVGPVISSARAGDFIWCRCFRCSAENLEARHGWIMRMMLLPIPLPPSRRSL